MAPSSKTSAAVVKSAAVRKPKILLFGLPGSGKSSIQKVVFHSMSANETVFLESTSKVIKNDISNSSFVQFQVWDFPGQLDFVDPTFDSQSIFGDAGAIVFVVDAQDEYAESLEKLNKTVRRAYEVNPSICFEVFIHKTDGLSDDSKIECQRDVQQQTLDALADDKLEHIHVSFYLTSIYDISIFEAFSKVCQKLIPQLPTLENLLDILVSSSRIEKAFLVDVVSKIYVATDSSPVDMHTYELCSDMIDVVIDVSCIYGVKDPGGDATKGGGGGGGASVHDEDNGEALGYDERSQCVIRLSNGMVLSLREVNKYLALVCLTVEENFEKEGLIEYNFDIFKSAIARVFQES